VPTHEGIAVITQPDRPPVVVFVLYEFFSDPISWHGSWRNADPQSVIKEGSAALRLESGKVGAISVTQVDAKGPGTGEFEGIGYWPERP